MSKVSRDFQPQSYFELICDYAYVIHDDDVSSASRKSLKLKLFQLLLPRVYPQNLPLLLRESRGSPLRSLMLVYSENNAPKNADMAVYQQFNVQLFTDDEINKTLAALDELQQQNRAALHRSLGSIADIYSHRLRLRQAQLSQQFFELNQLPTYLQPPETPEADDEQLFEANHFLTSQLLNIRTQYYNQQSDCVKNTLFQNLMTTLKQQLQMLNQQQFNFNQQTVQLTIQDFRNQFAAKNLETLDLKVSQSCSYPLLFTNYKQLTYDVIQQQFPLCDDPSKPWFYVNDVRTVYNIPLDSVPYGRLLINGNSLKQPSCVLQEKQLQEGAEELAQNYQHFETVIAKACHALAQLLVSATKHSKRAASIIQEDIKQIQKKTPSAVELGIKPNDFSLKREWVYRKDPFEEVEDFILSNSSLLNVIGFDWRQLPGADKYEELKNKPGKTDQESFLCYLIQKLQLPKNVTQSRNWIMDFDEMFVLNRDFNPQSSVSLYTQEPTLKGKQDDVIVIRPKYIQSNYTLHVSRTGRRRITYDTVCLLAQFLSLVGNVDPLPKRSYTHILLFNEKIALKNLFVPLDIAEQCEQERLQLNKRQNSVQVNQRINAENTLIFYELVVNRLKLVTSRDKFAKVKVGEDYAAGECNVCNTRFDSYKHHILTNEHLRNYRQLLLQNDNMVIALQNHQTKFELIQAINTQFNSIASTLASEFNCSWHQACNSINESIKSIGGCYQLDTEDAPRANSPNCKTNHFARWREDICLRRQGVLESVLTSGAARKSGYKRIKQCAASFASCVVGMDFYRIKSVERYLEDLFDNGVVVSIQNDDDSKHYEQNEEQQINYDVKVASGSLISGVINYKYPADVIHPEVCYVRLRRHDSPVFMFHEEGYDKMMQVAFISLLCRAAQGQNLTADQIIQRDDKDVDEVLVSEDAYILQVMHYLSDNYPQLDGQAYQNELQKLMKQRRSVYKQKQSMKKALPLDVLKLDVKSLRDELSDLEIGHLPKTDMIVHLMRTLFQIKDGKSLSVNSMYKLAVQSFKDDKLVLMDPKIKSLISSFITSGQLVNLNDIQHDGENSDSADIDYNQGRIKLPEIDIFDPLIKPRQEITQLIEQSVKQTDDNLIQSKQSALNEQKVYGVEGENECLSNILNIISPNVNELNVQKQLTNLPRDKLQQVIKNVAQKLNISINGVLFDTTQDYTGVEKDRQLEQSNIFLEQKPEEPEKPAEKSKKDKKEFEWTEDPCRSGSCFGRIRGGDKRKVQKDDVRANSVSTTNNIDLEPNQISVYLQLSEEEIPVFTAKTSSVSAGCVTLGSVATNNKFIYEDEVIKQYEQCKNQNEQDPQQRSCVQLKVNYSGKQIPVVASPILSTNLQETFYQNFINIPSFAMNQKDVRKHLQQFIPITQSQLNAVYACLSTVYGGFASYIDISVQFWKSAADALLGTSASISSVTSDQAAYGLKTADIASCTLVGLSARSKLLEEKYNDQRKEKRLQVQSKTVGRCIPGLPIVGEEVVQSLITRQSVDVKIQGIEPVALTGVGMDFMIAGVYGLNGTDGGGQ